MKTTLAIKKGLNQNNDKESNKIHYNNNIYKNNNSSHKVQVKKEEREQRRQRNSKSDGSRRVGETCPKKQNKTKTKAPKKRFVTKNNKIRKLSLIFRVFVVLGFGWWRCKLRQIRGEEEEEWRKGVWRGNLGLQINHPVTTIATTSASTIKTYNNIITATKKLTETTKSTAQLQLRQKKNLTCVWEKN